MSPGMATPFISHMEPPIIPVIIWAIMPPPEPIPPIIPPLAIPAIPIPPVRVTTWRVARATSGSGIGLLANLVTGGKLDLVGVSVV